MEFHNIEIFWNKTLEFKYSLISSILQSLDQMDIDV